MLLHQNGAFVEISHFGHELNSILSSFERKFPSPHLLLPTNPSLSCWESIPMERGSSTPSGQTLPSTPLFCLSSPVSSPPSDVWAGAGDDLDHRANNVRCCLVPQGTIGENLTAPRTAAPDGKIPRHHGRSETEPSHLPPVLHQKQKVLCPLAPGVWVINRAKAAGRRCVRAGQH